MDQSKFNELLVAAKAANGSVGHDTPVPKEMAPPSIPDDCRHAEDGDEGV